MTEWVRGNEREVRAEGGEMGGTMRCGAYEAVLQPGTRVAEIYGVNSISERHRHRYEVNIAYRDAIEATGLKFSGLSPDGVLPELCERADHPWFVGVQFHPELKSRPFDPHPLFASFIGAAKERSRLVKRVVLGRQPAGPNDRTIDSDQGLAAPCRGAHGRRGTSWRPSISRTSRPLRLWRLLAPTR
jgi:hypothetical protein